MVSGTATPVGVPARWRSGGAGLMETFLAIIAFPLLLGFCGVIIDRLPESTFTRLFRLFGFKDDLS